MAEPAFRHLPEATWIEVQRLLTVESLWALALVLAGWFIATVVGGLIGLAVTALLLVYGLRDLWHEVERVWDALQQWFTGWYEATTDAELQAAGQHLAMALSTGGLVVLQVVLTHKAFKLAEAPLRRRFAVPEWLRSKYEEATRERRRASEAAREPRRNTTSPVDAVLLVTKAHGARELAKDFPTAPVVAGVLGVVAATGVTWWALTAQAPRRKPTGETR